MTQAPSTAMPTLLFPPDMEPQFQGQTPFEVFERWMGEAEQAEPADANAMQLATVDAAGLPNLRTVLLKGTEDQSAGAFALLFYTNYNSAKGRELDASGVCAVNFHWKSLRRQFRARGDVARVEAEVSDAYFHSRPHGSRIGASVSAQSQPLASRSMLMAETQALAARYPTTPPRPAHWGGYRLIPREVEFWEDGPYRQHNRFRWTRQAADADAPWLVERLYP
ncbi:MAG: pyridoxamine 5'-phosphate oxidase [Pseudomonadota bacterium]